MYELWDQYILMMPFTTTGVLETVIKKLTLITIQLSLLTKTPDYKQVMDALGTKISNEIEKEMRESLKRSHAYYCLTGPVDPMIKLIIESI